MKTLKEFTTEDIRSWGPCYGPEKYLSEDWRGNILDIIDLKDCPFEDRLWVILRKELLSDKLMRLFAVWCARQVQHLTKDEGLIKALDVVERFANDEATKVELNAARDAAWDASRDAAWDASRDAACSAAWAAAWDASRDAAWAAARDAAWAAAWAAAWDASRDAAWAAQENKLREMIKAGIKTGDVVCEDA